MQERPTLEDVYTARRIIGEYINRTPLHNYPGLSRALGTEVYLKHENHHATGAFKIRGGLNLISHLHEGEKARGVISASTGNHGQYAGSLGDSLAPQPVGVPAAVPSLVVMPYRLSRYTPNLEPLQYAGSMGGVLSHHLRLFRGQGA